MNIKDEEAPIFAIRVDQNKDNYFKCFVGQNFYKEGCQVVQIYQDFNAMVLHGKHVYKIVARDISSEMEYVWYEFIEPTRTQVKYFHPNKTEEEMMETLIQDESFRS